MQAMHLACVHVNVHALPVFMQLACVHAHVHVHALARAAVFVLYVYNAARLRKLQNAAMCISST